ncbi:MAG TPA: ABC transporter substrate-binding protein [Burkholderiales bacterium]|nr:ABC transporter substrate-binding protein [Burkholderiales bacterium]
MRKFSLFVAAFSALVLAGAAAAQQPAPKDPKVYKIGAILAMSGQASFYGTVMSQGIKQAVEEINAKGGVNGIPLEAVIEDHKSGNAQEAVSAMNRLITINDVKIVMTSFSAPTQAIAPLADQHNIFLINGGGVSNNLVGVSKYIFHNRSLAADLGLAAAAQLQSMGVKKLAVLHWKNDAGDSVVRAVTPYWTKLGGTIVATEAVPQGATNMDTQIAKIRAANPDAIGLWMFNPETGLAVKRIREFGMKQPVIGIEYTANDAKIAGALGEGYLFINDYFEPSADQPWSQRFAEGYEKRYKSKPDFYAANYYEGVYVIAELLKRARAKGGDYMTGEALKAALYTNPKFDSVYGGQMVFQPNGVALKRVGLFKVEGDKNKFEKFVEVK